MFCIWSPNHHYLLRIDVQLKATTAKKLVIALRFEELQGPKQHSCMKTKKYQGNILTIESFKRLSWNQECLSSQEHFALELLWAISDDHETQILGRWFTNCHMDQILCGDGSKPHVVFVIPSDGWRRKANRLAARSSDRKEKRVICPGNIDVMACCDGSYWIRTFDFESNSQTWWQTWRDSSLRWWIYALLSTRLSSRPAFVCT